MAFVEMAADITQTRVQNYVMWNHYTAAYWSYVNNVLKAVLAQATIDF